MFNSLSTQYVIQAPGYPLFTNKAGCISGCASGISPVLKLDHGVFVDTSIVQQLKALFCCKDFGLLFIFFGGGGRCFASSLSNHRVVNIIGGRRFLSR